MTCYFDFCNKKARFALKEPSEFVQVLYYFGELIFLRCQDRMVANFNLYVGGHWVNRRQGILLRK